MALKPEFISLLRDIRDRVYPELSHNYDEVERMYNELILLQSSVDVIYQDIRTIESNIVSIEQSIHAISVGVVNTIDVNPDGSHGIASAVYNSLTAKLDFGLPAGSDGARGIPGNKGDQGVQGVDGPIGPKGDQGNVGNTGPQGIQGIDGQRGLVGPKGDTGQQGVTGSTGAQGSIGPVGPDGNIGPQGVPGLGVDIKGSDTVSVIKAKPSNNVGEAWIATDTGLDDNGLSINVGDVLRATGAKWITIGPITGPQGQQGNIGPQGIQGIQGQQGIQGDQGSQGDKGIQGDKGQNGSQGPTGDKGDQGNSGQKGDTGSQGVQGIEGQKGDKGDVGPKGDKGSTGIQGNTGPKGDKGDIGLTGLQGVQGIKGDKGDAGSLTLQRLEFLSVDGQTSYTITYDVGVHMQVIHNGLTLDQSGYTANSGIDVILTTPANVNDIVQIWTYKGFDVADVFTKAESDQRYAIESEHYTMTQADARFVNSSGGSVSGNLSMAVQPTDPAHLTRKDYVDASSSDKLKNTTDTLTGDLTVTHSINSDVMVAGQVAIFDNFIEINKDKPAGWITMGLYSAGGTSPATQIQSRGGTSGVASSGTLLVTAEKFLLNGDDILGHNGTTAKGLWTKFADGTMIQSGRVTSPASGIINISMPMLFIDLNWTLTCNATSATHAVNVCVHTNAPTIAGRPVVARYGDNTPAGVNIDWIAHGRWK